MRKPKPSCETLALAYGKLSRFHLLDDGIVAVGALQKRLADETLFRGRGGVEEQQHEDLMLISLETFSQWYFLLGRN